MKRLQSMYKNLFHSAVCALVMGSGASSYAGATISDGIQSPPPQNRNASGSGIKVPPTVETAVCTVVFKSSIDAAQPLGATNPIHTLATTPAICNGNSMMAMGIAGGVNQMLATGFRLINVSHQVTTLTTAPNGKTELLISAMFAMERVNNYGMR